MNVKKAIVLIVDEATDNLIQMNGMLEDQYEVRLANSGRWRWS
jgi:putative two-component system response regulator